MNQAHVNHISQSNPIYQRYDPTTIYLVNEISDTAKYASYAVTVVFKSGGHAPAEDKWISYYKNQVLQKIRRRLASGKLKQANIPLIDDLVQYELDISSKFPIGKKGRSVHHVHGIVAVPVEYKVRIENELGSVDDRIQRDIHSMTEVSTVKIEPLLIDAAWDWLSYMTKGKRKADFSWNK